MRKLWTQQELEYLVAHFPDDRTQDIADYLDRPICSVYGKANSLGLKKSQEFYNSDKSGRLTGMEGIKTRFKKGHEPSNKGKKIEPTEAMKATWYKPGHKPGNTLHDGAITIRDKYKFIRLSEGRWVHYHRYLWEHKKGPIPKGLNLVFKDGNTLNCIIENLELITNEELMRRNTIHRYPEELKDTMRTLGRLKSKIKNHGKK